MKQRCTRHEFKEFTQFNKRAAAPDGLQSRCRECSRKWYLANREAHMENVRRRNKEERLRIKQRVRALLASSRSVDCVESDCPQVARTFCCTCVVVSASTTLSSPT